MRFGRDVKLNWLSVPLRFILERFRVVTVLGALLQAMPVQLQRFGILVMDQELSKGGGGEGKEVFHLIKASASVVGVDSVLKGR
ncbi:hypothetical protein FRX31_007993, partial [Thalictrum thalictroides]